jgi:penicillin-binding protein 1C
MKTTLRNKMIPAGILTVLLLGLLTWILTIGSMFDDPYSTVLFDRNGELMGARIADDGQWRFPPIQSVPLKYQECLLQFEDRYFFYHPGVNPPALLRALRQNLAAGKVVSGGSTLTMQVVRISRKGKPRTVFQKMIEILMALRLELTSSKKEILALYASHAPIGGNVVGIEAASWRYFGRPPDQLSWAESAVLAVLPNAPSMIHPGRNRSLLMDKRNHLLHELAQAGTIDSMTLALSCLEPLPENPLPLPSLAPHLMDYFYLNQRGHRITSTLDETWQRRVASIVEKHHQKLKFNEIHNAACLVIETMSGEVIAYVGNTEITDPGYHSRQVDMIRSSRSTGSILKPLLYCLMLEEGDLLPGTLVPDVPTQYTGYSPKNFNLEYDGAVPAHRALSRSLNIPAVRMLQSYGLEKFHHRLKQLGMETLNSPAEHYGLSLILGGAEADLEWITGLYASMGRILQRYNQTGEYVPDDLHLPLFVSAPTVKVKPVSIQNPYPFSAASIWLTFEALLKVNRPESQAGWESFYSGQEVSWKTGTSFGFRDAWAIGTGPAYTVGVWAGNADGEGRPGLTGISSAAPILFDVFSLLPGREWFDVPVNELHEVSVCSQSGFLPGPYCPETSIVLIPKNGLNSLPCPFHKIIHLTLDGRYRVDLDCRDPDQIRHEPWFILPPLQEWYYRAKNPWYRILPEIHPECQGEDEIPSMEMIYPKHSARVYVPMELSGERGKIILEAVHRNPGTTIHWHLNNEYIGQTRHIHQMGISPEKGSYLLTLVDAHGQILTRHFNVVDR